MISPPFRLTRAVLLVLVCTGALVACGKRGALDPPAGSEQAKSEAAKDAGQNNGSISPTGGGKRIPVLPPKRDLPIDFLLD